jgi:hypothetical protein
MNFFLNEIYHIFLIMKIFSLRSKYVLKILKLYDYIPDLKN